MLAKHTHLDGALFENEFAHMDCTTRTVQLRQLCAPALSVRCAVSTFHRLPFGCLFGVSVCVCVRCSLNCIATSIRGKAEMRPKAMLLSKPRPTPAHFSLSLSGRPRLRHYFSIHLSFPPSYDFRNECFLEFALMRICVRKIYNLQRNLWIIHHGPCCCCWLCEMRVQCA